MEIIHIVLGKANPDRMNGVNKVVYQLATEQADSGCNVSVWGISHNTQCNFGDRNFKTQLFVRKRNPFGLNKHLKKAILATKGKSVFHIHGGWVPVFWALAQLLKKNNIPFVFTPHGAYNILAMQRNGLVKKLYFRFFENTLLRHAAKIHCIGKSEVLGLNQFFKTSNTILLPYGYKAISSTKTTTSGSFKLIIGFVGRLDIYTKGLDLLIEAFKDLKQQIPESELWIIGDSEEKNTLEQLIKLNLLDSSVKLFGAKFNEEKENLIKQMDVFVHPSRNEGLPASVLEAANLGITCIVSEATNLSDYVNIY
ncbi:MAG: glycosyltransferase family 4 protein [Bacteroidia bacterium]|nr:glycosyltransferase family 4 protein [Bacteroidia bacterium]